MDTQKEIKKLFQQIIDSAKEVMRSEEDIEAFQSNLKKDIAAFMVYLSMRDGMAQKEELSKISEMCDINLDGDNIQDFIEEYGIASFEFASTIPESFQKALEIEVVQSALEVSEEIADASNISGEKNSMAISEMIKDTYRKIGETALSADGRITETEVQGYKAYVEMLNSCRCDSELE